MRIVVKIIYRQLGLVLSLMLLLVSFNGNTQSACKLDSVLASLRNEALYVAPVIRGVWIFPVAAEKSEEKRPSFVVSSLAEDIRTMQAVYTKDTLAKKLYALLSDPERDLYANALLYDLLDNEKLSKLFAMKREEWIRSGKQKCDIEFWKARLTANGILAEDDPVQYIVMKLLKRDSF